MQIIIDAIHQKRVLKLWYGGGDRLIEPHCYGMGREGQGLLRCFQISGFSSSNAPFAWKLLTVAEIQDPSLTDQTFPTPRTDYNPQDKAMARVIAALPASAVTRAWR